MLATCSVPFRINLNKLANEYKVECSYEPELHPGATFRVKEYKCTLKLFTTGSITLTAPSVLFVQKSIDFIYKILCKYRHEQIDFEEKPQVVQEMVAEQLTPSYLITKPLNPINCPTIINLNKSEYITTSPSSTPPLLSPVELLDYNLDYLQYQLNWDNFNKINF